MSMATRTDTQSPALHVADSHDLIRVQGARENNLKDVSIEIPKRRLTVFTGVSGSGKSSLVFGTIAAESQRLIHETYSAFVQGFMPTLARPEVDVLDGLTTAIIVDQERMGANVGMKPWTKVLYVSLIIRCDSAAIVWNTRELLPEPETPVNTVSRRVGISMLTSLRLFTRAPCTRITSGLRAVCSAGDCVSFRVAVLTVSRVPAFASGVLNQPEDVAVGVGERRHQTAAPDVARGLLQNGAGSGDLGQLRLDVRDMPEGHR